MLVEFKKRTQFIVITHNPRTTTEAADVVYGVTMQEPGVSSLVSVRMRGNARWTQALSKQRRRDRRLIRTNDFEHQPAVVGHCRATCGHSTGRNADRDAQAQAAVQVTGPAKATLSTDGIGTFSIVTSGFSAEDLPLRGWSFQISRTADFSGVLFADTTVDEARTPLSSQSTHLLHGTGVLFWRVFALTARAGSVPSPVVGPRTAPTNLSLISPNNPSGQSLRTTRPTFVWHASTIPPSVGAWEFEIRVEETATARVVFDGTTTDTTLTAAADLETNDSFRWRVIARLRANR